MIKYCTQTADDDLKVLFTTISTSTRAQGGAVSRRFDVCGRRCDLIREVIRATDS